MNYSAETLSALATDLRFRAAQHDARAQGLAGRIPPDAASKASHGEMLATWVEAGNVSEHTMLMVKLYLR